MFFEFVTEIKYLKTSYKLYFINYAIIEHKTFIVSSIVLVLISKSTFMNVLHSWAVQPKKTV